MPYFAAPCADQSLPCRSTFPDQDETHLIVTLTVSKHYEENYLPLREHLGEVRPLVALRHSGGTLPPILLLLRQQLGSWSTEIATTRLRPQATQ